MGGGGGLLGRLRSRTLFAGIVMVEVALGAVMAGGAWYFAMIGAEYAAWVLAVKAAGFLGLAAFSAGDLRGALAVVRV